MAMKRVKEKKKGLMRDGTISPGEWPCGIPCNPAEWRRRLTELAIPKSAVITAG